MSSPSYSLHVIITLLLLLHNLAFVPFSLNARAFALQDHSSTSTPTLGPFSLAPSLEY